MATRIGVIRYALSWYRSQGVLLQITIFPAFRYIFSLLFTCCANKLPKFLCKAPVFVVIRAGNSHESNQFLFMNTLSMRNELLYFFVNNFAWRQGFYPRWKCCRIHVVGVDKSIERIFRTFVGSLNGSFIGNVSN